MNQLLAVSALVAVSLHLLLPVNPGNRLADGASANWLVGNRNWTRNKLRPGNNRKQAELISTDVAALLRSGIPAGAAWRRAAGIPVDELGIPDQASLAELVGEQAAAAMNAASQLALRSGSPLAAVLGTVDQALRIEAETQAERKAALAGPQTTARVLLGLPLFGLLLGWVLGVDPLKMMVSGGVGSWSMLAGLVMLGAGKWWISKLVSVAAGASAQ